MQIKYTFNERDYKKTTIKVDLYLLEAGQPILK